MSAFNRELVAGKADLGVALVTGASTGIGRATAKALKDAGFRVFGTSRRPVSESPDGITMLIGDVTDDASVAKLVDEVIQPQHDARTCTRPMGLAVELFNYEKYRYPAILVGSWAPAHVTSPAIAKPPCRRRESWAGKADAEGATRIPAALANTKALVAAAHTP